MEFRREIRIQPAFITRISIAMRCDQTVLRPLIEETYASWTAAPAVNSGDIGLEASWTVCTWARWFMIPKLLRYISMKILHCHWKRY